MLVVKPWVLVVGAVAVAAVAILLWSLGGGPEDEIAEAAPPSASQIATSEASDPPPAGNGGSPGGAVLPDGAPPTEEAPPEGAAVTPGPAATPLVAIDGVIHAGEYPRSTTAAGFQIHWGNDLAMLRMGLVSPGTGYVAIGFDPEDRMEGGNFILGAVVGATTRVRDDVGNGPYSHAADTALGGRDNIVSAAGRESDGKTVLEFVIPLNSRDAMDRQLVPGQTYTILVAYHDWNDDFSAKHSRRGAGEIRLEP